MNILAPGAVAAAPAATTTTAAPPPRTIKVPASAAAPRRGGRGRRRGASRRPGQPLARRAGAGGGGRAPGGGAGPAPGAPRRPLPAGAAQPSDPAAVALAWGCRHLLWRGWSRAPAKALRNGPQEQGTKENSSGDLAAQSSEQASGTRGLHLSEAAVVAVGGGSSEAFGAQELWWGRGRSRSGRAAVRPPSLLPAEGGSEFACRPHRRARGLQAELGRYLVKQQKRNSLFSGVPELLVWGCEEEVTVSSDSRAALGTSKGGEGGGGGYTNVIQPSALKSECVLKDMEIWESSGQWMFSCYSPMREEPNVSGFSDLSPEELRLEYYNCRANFNIQSYIFSVQQLAEQWKNRLCQLKASQASTKAALLPELKKTTTRPLPVFGFGGQQTSGFGLSGFPVKSSSTSASDFSFKTSSSRVGPALGSSSADSNPPAFRLMSSPSVPPSAGFGSLATPSAASFSFQTSGTTRNSNPTGFSGFGSSAVDRSGTTPFPAFGDSNAAGTASPSHSSSAGFGQTASASGHHVTSTSSAVTSNSTSENLYTPMSKLTAEEVEQFKAKKFTLGKIPLNPPPVELLRVL
ncbi:nucleoporin NUP42-like [Leptosomus discolor]